MPHYTKGNRHSIPLSRTTFSELISTNAPPERVFYKLVDPEEGMRHLSLPNLNDKSLPQRLRYLFLH